ncbi:hypothetical protein EVAR_84487_1 [Eumeta japonica]|uniref:Uncharacterized protein n=1 Tax=Eumeta variegata TaxID=151549 RepID=A0A4C1UIE7_EUMVA|nr:hypothetical protein EVAR_84487_1 [Eumeta japonica]
MNLVDEFKIVHSCRSTKDKSRSRHGGAGVPFAAAAGLLRKNGVAEKAVSLSSYRKFIGPRACDRSGKHCHGFYVQNDIAGQLNGPPRAAFVNKGRSCAGAADSPARYGLTGKTKQKKKATSIRTEISCTGGGASRKLILSEQEQRLLYIIGKSAVMGRGPEIGFQNVEAEIICTESEIISRDPEIISTPLNVEISAEQVIVPVEQALNQSQLSRTLLQQFLLLVVFCLHDQIPKMKKMQSHQEQLDVYPSSRQETSSTTYAISNGVRTVCRNRAERLDLEERRLEVDRLREENIAQNRQLQEKFLQDVVGTVLIERSSGGQHLAAFQAFEDSTDSRH